VATGKALATSANSARRARSAAAAADGEPGTAGGIGSVPDRGDELVRLLKLNERREPLVVQVATWVGLGVIEGRLRPGQDLNSVDLSHRFKTSRTPVREALMLLEQEGLVEIRARWVSCRHYCGNAA
jgi:hypothetical protein